MNQTTPWLHIPAADYHQDSREQAWHRQNQLTKPTGSLGRLEEIVLRLAAMQGSVYPKVEHVHITVFAGDHGVAEEGISCFPQEVTAQMLQNFARGGAAISVLAKALDAELELINLGTVHEVANIEGIKHLPLGPGTANFLKGPAMDEHQLDRAMNAGRHSAERAKMSGAQLFIGGEMGIGNTTSAAALACALTHRPPKLLAGPGTGLDAPGILHKIAVIEQALQIHQGRLHTPIQCLQYLGGFEIAALSGAYLACAQMGLPVLIDGFISSSAAIVTQRICPQAGRWFFYAHQSAEPGHQYMLANLEAEPLLDLGMRLGEGSGAAVAVPILRLACALHNNMASFAEAAVTPANV